MKLIDKAAEKSLIITLHLSLLSSTETRLNMFIVLVGITSTKLPAHGNMTNLVIHFARFCLPK